MEQFERKKKFTCVPGKSVVDADLWDLKSILYVHIVFIGNITFKQKARFLQHSKSGDLL